MASMSIRQALNIVVVHSSVAKLPSTSIANPKSHSFISKNNNIVHFYNLSEFSSKRKLVAVSKASSANTTTTYKDEDGVSLGTMKLPSNTDVARFETLLFQWGNSLCQGAMLPLPVPLKVDKIPGGARLNFIAVDDGKTETIVYIDCLVFPATDTSGPIFRAIRNGVSRDQPCPGEERIMRGLLGALKKCVEIARI